MSAFEKVPDETQVSEDVSQRVSERGSEQSAPFITKIGAVTVAHSKPSTDSPPKDFDYCLPCENPPTATSDDTDSDDEGVSEEKLPPVERNITPRDVTEIEDTDEVVYVVGTQGSKVTRLHNLENMTNLQELTCRSCLIGSMDGLVENHSTLVKLELYDNHIQKFSNLEFLKNLVILDMSYNAIRDMKPVEACVHLEELYLAQNKLRQVQGLKNLTKLRTLDLGANRIRVIDAVTSLTSLKSLWLGKNKIEEIPDMSALQSLRQLDIQSNRLTALGEGLQNLTNLEELYLACNNIHLLDGLPRCLQEDSHPQLNTLDVTSNKIENVEPVSHLQSLEEFWISSNLIASTEALLPLQALPSLSCIYLENSPIQASLKSTYKADVLAVLPKLTQLDASLVSSGR
jgi:protein phosphatase 1 regulatory subunit 7